MNLSKATEEKIKGRMDSGKYADQEAVIRDAMGALDILDRERERLRSELAEAMEECRRGEATPGDPFFRKLLEENAVLAR